MLAYEYPQIKMLIVRRTLPELRENHTNELLAAYNTFPEEHKPKYTDNEKAFWFPNGSRLKLGYCDNETDVLQYQGQEYDILFLDEATQLTEYQFYWLKACVRGANGRPKRIYLTCNPDGVGYSWVKGTLIDKDPEYIANTDPKDITFIQALVWDNQPLFDKDEGYIKAVKAIKAKYNVRKLTPEMNREAMEQADYVQLLKSNPDVDLRRAHLDGDWNVFQGKFFKEFSRSVHIVKPFQIPEHWRKTAAIDYGLDMFAVVWMAVAPDGMTYCYRAKKQQNLIVSSAAQTFLDWTTERNIQAVYAPPDLWNRRNDTGRSAAEIFASCGVPLIKSGNDRESGWLATKEYLKHKDNDGNEIKGYPRMVFFDGDTDALVRDMQNLQYDQKKRNDAATNPHDVTHLPDALRYWCAPHQLATKETPIEPPNPFNLKRPRRDDGVSEDYLIGGYHNC